MKNIPTEFSLKEIKDFSELEIEDIQLQPLGNNVASDTGNRVIEFNLPRDSFLNSQESYLTYSVQIGTTGNHHDWCESIFNNIKIQVGNVLVLDEQETGFWRVLNNNYTYKYTNRLSATGGMRGSDASSFDAVNQPRRFYVSLFDHFSKYGISNFFKDLLPLYKMDTVKIKLYLNPNIIQYLEGGATGITITKPILNIRLIDSPSLRKEYKKDIVRNFISYHHYVDNVIIGQSKISTVIPFNNKSILGVLVTQRPSNVLSRSDVNGKYAARFTVSKATKGNIMIDGKGLPSIPYDYTNNVENIRNLERFFDVEHLGYYISESDIINFNDFGGYDPTQDTSTQYLYPGIELRFVLALPFNYIKEYISGVNGESLTGTAKLNIDIDAVDNCQVDIFVKYNKFYKISADGSFSVTE